MMIVTKVWCLPASLPEESLRELHLKILAAFQSGPGPAIRDEKDMVVLFPADLMKYGLGEEIIVEIGIPASLGDQLPVSGLARGVGKCVHGCFPKARVDCRITFTPDGDLTSWDSAEDD